MTIIGMGTEIADGNDGQPPPTSPNRCLASQLADTSGWKVLTQVSLLAVIAATLVYLLVWIMAMSSTSLWGDEFGSIGSYSSKGPLKVMTDYKAPKNHVFFNLINSVLPGRQSYNPLRARMASIVAVLGTVAVAVWFFRKSQLDLAIPVFLGLWVLNKEAMHLSLQARGYGLLGLFAIGSTVFLWSFLKCRDWRMLAGAVGLSVLGIYTVPAYVFFCTPLLATALCLQLTWRNVAVCAGGGVVTVLLYLPILGQMAKSATGFAAKYPGERTFDSWRGIESFLRTYFFPDVQVALLGSAALTLALLVLLWVKDRLSAKQLAVVTAGIVGFFLAALVMVSLPMRVASFMAVPVALAFSLGLAASVRLWKPVNAVAIPMACAFFTLVAVSRCLAFSFTPNEDWFTAVRALEVVGGPACKVHLQYSAKNMRHYLPKDRAVRESTAELAWKNGEVYVDTGTTWAGETDREKLPTCASDQIIDLSVSGQHKTIHLSFVGRPIIPIEGLSASLPPQTEPVILVVTASPEVNSSLRLEHFDGAAWRDVPDILRVREATLARVPASQSIEKFRVRLPENVPPDGVNLRAVALSRAQNQ